MAEDKTNPEVEIDTSGVSEETIEVDAPKVSEEAFEKKQDVDLGYVDVSGGGKTAKELLQETKEEPDPEVKTEPQFEQVEEKEEVIKQLRKEISILKQVEANNKWVELDA